MTCPNCAQAAARPLWGGYTTTCVHCCARLVVSARPLRHAQEAFFAMFERRIDGPTKADIIRAIGQLDAAKNPPAEVSQGVAPEPRPARQIALAEVSRNVALAEVSQGSALASSRGLFG